MEWLNTFGPLFTIPVALFLATRLLPKDEGTWAKSNVEAASGAVEILEKQLERSERERLRYAKHNAELWAQLVDAGLEPTPMNGKHSQKEWTEDPD